MTGLCGWSLDGPASFARAERSLASLVNDEVVLDDARAVSWPAGRPGPAVRPVYGVAITNPVPEALWSLLIGVALYPRAPLADAAATDPADRLLAGWGIAADAVAGLRQHLRPGRHALLVVADPLVLNRLVSGLGEVSDVAVWADSIETRARSLPT